MVAQQPSVTPVPGALFWPAQAPGKTPTHIKSKELLKKKNNVGDLSKGEKGVGDKAHGKVWLDL